MFRSIHTQILVISIAIAFIILLSIGETVSNQVNKQTRNDYINNSNEQMNLVDNAIKNFYSQIDKDINMMATDPLVMQADNTITAYNNNPKMQMTPSKNGGREQQIYEFFKRYGDSHPGTMYVYFGTGTGSYLQWPETEIPANEIFANIKRQLEEVLEDSKIAQQINIFSESVKNVIAIIDGVTKAANEGVVSTINIANKVSDVNIKSNEVMEVVLKSKESAEKLKDDIKRFKV